MMDRMKAQTAAKQTSYQQLLHQTQLLKELNHALEKENESRGQQSVVMQAEIDRLSRLEREWSTKPTAFSVSSSSQYLTVKQEYTQLRIKYDSLLLETHSLNSKIKNLELASSSFTWEKEKTRLTESIKTYETRISNLQAQILTYQSQIRQLKLHQTQSSTISQQYSTSLTQVRNFESQIKIKTDQISRLQRQAGVRQEQLTSLRGQITVYSSKINFLSEELDRLQKSQKIEHVRYIDSHQLPMLKAEVQTGKDRLRKAELKVSSLQGANEHLSNELRIAIQQRSRSSLNHQESTLKQTILTLKAELQQIREFNELVLRENKELVYQVQQPKGHQCHKHKHTHNYKAHLSDDKLNRSKGDGQLGISSALMTQGHSHNHKAHNDRSQLSFGYHEYSAPISSTAHDRRSEIERKIQLLQSENRLLKSKLTSDEPL